MEEKNDLIFDLEELNRYIEFLEEQKRLILIENVGKELLIEELRNIISD